MTRKNIYFIGLPGAGKSFFAAHLAKDLSMKFIDMEQLLKQKTGKSIASILATDGEETLYDLASKLLQDLSLQENLLVACLSDITEREENIELLASSGRAVFIDRPVEKIARDPFIPHQPVLPVALSMLKELYGQNAPSYRRAAAIVFANDGEPADMLKKLHALLQKWD